MDTYDQPGTFTKISIKNLQSPDIDPVDILYDYLDCPVFSKPLVFLYYFFDKDGTLFDKDDSGSYTKLSNPYLRVVNKVLMDALKLEKSGISMTKPQSRETYIKFALYFNSLSNNAYHALFPASYTGSPYRPECTYEKMDACLNAIGEESLNPMILQEAVWMLGLELGFTSSICDDIMQKFNMEDSPTAERGATTMLFSEIKGIIPKLQNEPSEQKKQDGVIEFLKSRAKAFKGYSQTRQHIWNKLVKKYTGKEDLSINELYRLLNFRFLFFGKTDKRKTIDLDRQVKDVLLPPQYDRFWNIAGTDRLSNTVFWTFLSNLSNDAVQTAKEQLKKRSESGEITQKNERDHINTAKIIASCVSTMDEEFDPARVEKALAGENLTLEPKVKTLCQLAQRYANLDQPTRNMILTLSYAITLQHSKGADAETVRGCFADRANKYLGLAGYGRLNTKLPLDAALYSCIQDDSVISLDELYERIINKKVEIQGIRNVNFELPSAADIKKILWDNRREIAEKREKTAKQTDAAQNNVLNTVADPAPNYTPNRDHLAHDKRFTELLNRGNSIDFMPINENRHIDPNGLCPGERLVPQDAASVQITVYPIYFEGENAKKAKMKATTDAREFLKSRVKDQVNIVAFDVKKNGNHLEARTENIPLNQVQITTPWHHNKRNILENQENPLNTYLEEAVPKEYLGPAVPKDAPASCRMVLEYINEAGTSCGKEILERDYHEEYRRYAEACFNTYLPKEALFHSVFTKLNQKVPDSPHDELYGWIFEEIKRAAQSYKPVWQFDTFIRNYVLGAIRKCAKEHWPQDSTVSIDAPADADDDAAAAQYRDIEQQIATQSAEDDVLQQLDGQKKNLEDLYNEHKDELLPLERYSLALLFGFDGYDYSQIDRGAYREFLDEADADAADEWECFVDDEMKQFGCTPPEIPIDRVRDYFKLADNDAAKQKKQQANNIYNFLHRQLTPSDIYTVFKDIEALNDFEVAKSDIQNFALFGYRKLIDAQ